MSQFLSTIAICVVVAIMTTSISNVDTKLEAIDKNCTLLEELAPPYIWGGYWGRLGGDCSGQVYDIVGKEIGAKRTTAYRMWIGYGNWGTNNVEGPEKGFTHGKFPNIAFFKYSEVYHTGIWRKKTLAEIKALESIKKETNVFAEASSSKRYFKRTVMTKGDARYKALIGTKIPNL
jgi:hypothetical protein